MSGTDLCGWDGGEWREWNGVALFEEKWNENGFKTSSSKQTGFFYELCYLNIHICDNFYDNQNFTKEMRYWHKYQNNREGK